MRLYLLRHGLTQHNLEGRYQGTSQDLPLSAQGRAGLCRAPWDPGRVYVSPLRRARETAAILFPQAAQVVAEELREMDFGAFEGHTYRELAQDPAYGAWVAGNCLGPCPGGESKETFCARTCAAVSEIMSAAARKQRETVVIVAHGGTQMAVLENYARPQRDYYASCAPCGAGYLLDWTETRRSPVVRCLELVQWGKGARRC